MSELTERLRSRAWEHRQHRALRDQAARHIDDLAAELAASETYRANLAQAHMDQAGRIRELEAALREIADAEPENWHNLGCAFEMQKTAKAALATAETACEHKGLRYTTADDALVEGIQPVRCQTCGQIVPETAEEPLLCDGCGHTIAEHSRLGDCPTKKTKGGDRGC